MRTAMLTTSDNPYSPFDNFDEWRAFDVQKGYYTLEYLARVCITSSELSDAEQESAIDDAIDSIVTTNILGIYKKVFKDSEEESLDSA